MTHLNWVGESPHLRPNMFAKKQAFTVLQCRARSTALRLFHRAVVLAARPVKIRIIWFAARQEPAPLEKPQSLP